MRLNKRFFFLASFIVISLSSFANEPKNMEIPMGPPPGGSTINTSKQSVTEGSWTFDIVTTVEGNKKATTSTITYYSGKTDEIVIIPSILGGAPVTKISSQAFGHHGEISAVYVPSTVIEVADWAFYDLNTAAFISFANPNVSIDESAFQSSGNAKLYLPKGTTIKKAGGKEVITTGTEKLSLKIINPENAIIGGEEYLNVLNNSYTINIDKVKSISKATGNISYNKDSLTFDGESYKVKESIIELFKSFKNAISISDLNRTFKSLTKEEAIKENEKVAKNNSYKDVKLALTYEEGYYLNGNKVLVDKNAKAFDVITGEEVQKDSTSNMFVSTGKGKYKYVYQKDTDNDGDIDEIYYYPYEQNYVYNSTKIKSNNKYLNGLAARDILNPLYLSFANGVIEAKESGTKIHEENLNISTESSGARLFSSINEERSLLWASNYGTIEVNKINGKSTSVGNWAKMSYESGLSAYNVELVMEWGMNALLYATNGGTIKVGNLKGDKSTFYATGDGANGIIAGGTGVKNNSTNELAETAKVYVYNSDFNLQGWNNHVADVVYGGYAYLEKINSTTGKLGSYSVGQGSALANDFGNGVVEVKDFNTTTYGNRSAGAYVIGGGVINATSSSFVSTMDAGLVIASGGTFNISNSLITGQMAIRNRGGIIESSTSTFNNSKFTVNRNFDKYNIGEKAKKAIDLWKKIVGSENLIHYMMSAPEMTLGKLFDNYGISESNQKYLLEEFSKITNASYSRSTLLRNSILDNSFYNYSAGKYIGETDFSDIPYLTLGSSFGGLVSSIVEFESAGAEIVFNESKFDNLNGKDFNYLIASEAGSNGKVVFNKSNATGIIWNEGDVSRVVEGRGGDRSSKLEVVFNNSKFEGLFSDGSNGLWNVKDLSYKDSKGEISSLNGNYYGAKSNFGISATFSEGSKWIITGDSYLGKLSIDKNSIISAQNGYELKMTVDGIETPIKEGIYKGNIIIKSIKK